VRTGARSAFPPAPCLRRVRGGPQPSQATYPTGCSIEPPACQWSATRTSCRSQSAGNREDAPNERLESQSGRVFRSAARSRSVARAERRNGTQARCPFRPIPLLLCTDRNSRRYAGAPRASRRAVSTGSEMVTSLNLVASPVAAPLHLALPAEVHSDEEGDGYRQEDPIYPVAAREVPKSKARFDCAENTEYAVLRRESLHRGTH